MNIQVARYLELPPELRERIDEAAWGEFGKFEIVRQTEWATPDWSFLAYEAGELVAYYNLVERIVRIDDAATRVVGVNNLVTMAGHRGRGHASRLLRETQPRWISELSVEAGVLLCADALLPFYSRLEWRRVSCPIVYAQRNGPRTWSESGMLWEPEGGRMPCRQLDLCGLPW